MCHIAHCHMSLHLRFIIALIVICLFPVLIHWWVRNSLCGQSASNHCRSKGRRVGYSKHVSAPSSLPLNLLLKAVHVVLLWFLIVTCHYVRVYMVSRKMVTLITAAQYVGLNCISSWSLLSFLLWCSNAHYVKILRDIFFAKVLSFLTENSLSARWVESLAQISLSTMKGIFNQRGRSAIDK